MKPWQKRKNVTVKQGGVVLNRSIAGGKKGEVRTLVAITGIMNKADMHIDCPWYEFEDMRLRKGRQSLFLRRVVNEVGDVGVVLRRSTLFIKSRPEGLKHGGKDGDEQRSNSRTRSTPC